MQHGPRIGKNNEYFKDITYTQWIYWFGIIQVALFCLYKIILDLATQLETNP